MTFDQFVQLIAVLAGVVFVAGLVAGFGWSMAQDVTRLRGEYPPMKRTHGQRWMEMQRRKRRRAF